MIHLDGDSRRIRRNSKCCPKKTQGSAAGPTGGVARTEAPPPPNDDNGEVYGEILCTQGRPPWPVAEALEPSDALFDAPGGPMELVCGRWQGPTPALRERGDWVGREMAKRGMGAGWEVGWVMLGTEGKVKVWETNSETTQNVAESNQADKKNHKIIKAWEAAGLLLPATARTHPGGCQALGATQPATRRPQGTISRMSSFRW